MHLVTPIDRFVCAHTLSLFFFLSFFLARSLSFLYLSLSQAGWSVQSLGQTRAKFSASGTSLILLCLLNDVSRCLLEGILT